MFGKSMKGQRSKIRGKGDVKIPRSTFRNLQTSQSIDYAGRQELLDAEIGLVGYSTDIVRKLSKGMNFHSEISDRRHLLEFGAGTGFLADIWRKRIGITPVCLEIDPTLIRVIRKKGFTCYSSFAELPTQYEGIYTSNVLEHIENDSATICELFDALTPHGVIGIYVPALPFLFSGMDEAVGHFRRYKRKELIFKVKQAGFRIESVHYVDFLGFFASIALKIFGFKGNAQIGSTKSLKFYDRCVYPLSRFLDSIGFRYVVGKNIILVARRDNED